MVIYLQARALHHKNSSREAKTTHSFCHWQRRKILSKHISEGLGLTFKDCMHCMSVQVIQIHSVYPESKAGSVSTIRSEALFIPYFDAYSTDRNCTLQMCKNSRFLPWRPNCLNRPKKQQKTKMKLKSEVKIWQFVIQLVTVVRSGPAGQSQDIYLSNPHCDEGISMKHCHTASEHYPTAAQFSLASHTLKSKNSNTPDKRILNMLTKAWEKPRGGLSPFLYGIVRVEGVAQSQWGKLMAEHATHSLPTPQRDARSTLTSLFLTNLRYLFC